MGALQIMVESNIPQTNLSVLITEQLTFGLKNLRDLLGTRINTNRPND